MESGILFCWQWMHLIRKWTSLAHPFIGSKQTRGFVYKVKDTSFSKNLVTNRWECTDGSFFFQNCTCTQSLHVVRLSNINLDSLTQRGLIIFGWSPLPTFQVTAIQLEISRTKAVIYNCQCMQRLKPRVRTDYGKILPLKLHISVNKVNLPV